MKAKLTVKTPAKINLFLHVVGKRADGYHLLESLFAPLAVYDTITVSPKKEILVNSNIPNNISLKVATHLKEAYDIKDGCEITIQKQIPIAAGMGGGSSDAAATLLLLNILWGLDLSHQDLLDHAVKIGADVPFFIDPKNSFVTGIGEVIEPFEIYKSYPLLVINPNVAVNTPEVYKMGFSEFTSRIQNKELIEDLILNGKNDLQNNAMSLCPEIGKCLEFLEAQEGILASRMNGSGATCFGIFKDQKSLNKAYNSVPKNWWKHHQLLEL